MIAFSPLTQAELNNLLDECDIGYYESGAYYDSSKESYETKCHEAIEATHYLSLMEF